MLWQISVSEAKEEVLLYRTIQNYSKSQANWYVVDSYRTVVRNQGAQKYSITRAGHVGGAINFDHLFMVMFCRRTDRIWDTRCQDRP